MRLSISFLLVIFSCYLALGFSQQLIQGKPCPKGRRICTRDHRPYCVKMADGTFLQTFGGSSCPPCGEKTQYYRGFCPKDVPMHPKSQ